MASESLTFFDYKTQIEFIKNVQTRGDYFDLYTLLMCDGVDSFWGKLVKAGVKKKAPKEMIQLLTLNLVQGAQQGYISMEGQKLRHDRNSYRKPIFADPPYHQLALTVYIAGHNRLTLTPRRSFQDQLDQIAYQNSAAVWGVMLPISRGRIISQSNDLDELIKKIDLRIAREKPICLPTPEFTNALASIGFTGEEAETIPKKTFRKIYAPQFKGVLEDIINIDPLIYRSKWRRFVTKIRGHNNR